MKARSLRLPHIMAIGLALSLIVSLLLPASAEKDYSGDHPLRVLKARKQGDQARSSAGSAKGNLTIWLQNPTSVVVDGVEVEVELYNDNRRKVDTLRRKLDDFQPGEKRVVTFRWDVLAERYVEPRFFIEYNARGAQKARFEGESPTGF